MASELAGEAATEIVGVMFREFLSAVLEVKDNARAFKPKLMQLEATLRELEPVIKEIEKLNKQLNQADQSETESLRRLMEEGKNLVSKCSEGGRWNILKRSRYQKKLVELDKEIVRFHMAAHTAIEVKRISLKVDKLSRRSCWPKCLSRV